MGVAKKTPTNGKAKNKVKGEKVSALRLFENSQFKVRAIELNEEPYFIAKDVCLALGLENTSRAVSRLDEDEKTTITKSAIGLINDLDINPKVIIINESGVYNLVFSSTKPEAKIFKKWVTSEVLPEIRKTGSYQFKSVKKKSTETRNFLTEQWQNHGADKFYHYINLTREEYKQLFGTDKKKKAEMTKEEIAKLTAFEGIEYFKLSQNKSLSGYEALKTSIQDTAFVLDLISRKQLTA